MEGILCRQRLADVAAHAFDIGQAHRAIGRAGGADADEGRLRMVDRVLHIAGCRQAARGHDFRDQGIQPVFDDGRQTIVDGLDLSGSTSTAMT